MPKSKHWVITFRIFLNHPQKKTTTKIGVGDEYMEFMILLCLHDIGFNISIIVFFVMVKKQPQNPSGRYYQM